MAQDRTGTIRASVHDVEYMLLLSIGLVILVVFIFLQRYLVEGVSGGAATGSAGVGNAPAAVAAEE